MNKSELAGRCNSAPPFDPAESKRIKISSRQSSSRLRAEQHQEAEGDPEDGERLAGDRARGAFPASRQDRHVPFFSASMPFAPQRDRLTDP